MATPKDNTFVVTVMDKDRVGIIANVAGALQRLGGNLEDVSQTVMRGYFTMILLARFSKEISCEEIQRGITKNQVLKDAVIGVLPYDPSVPVSAAPGDEARIYVLTASGPDQPGLVAAFSDYLQGRNINIVDLSTCVSQDGEYTMIWLIDLPPDIDIAKLKRSMELSMAPLKMKLALRNQEIFKQTNEI